MCNCDVEWHTWTNLRAFANATDGQDTVHGDPSGQTLHEPSSSTNEHKACGQSFCLEDLSVQGEKGARLQNDTLHNPKRKGFITSVGVTIPLGKRITTAIFRAEVQ